MRLHGAEHEHNPNWKHGHFGLHVLLELFSPGFWEYFLGKRRALSV